MKKKPKPKRRGKKSKQWTCPRCKLPCACGSLTVTDGSFRTFSVPGVKLVLWGTTT